VANTLEFGRSELGENLSGKLHTAIEGASKSEELYWERQPRLAEEGIRLGQDLLERTSIPGTNTSTDETYNKSFHG